MQTATSVPLPVPPTWFKQRQGKFEAAGEGMVKLTAPNLDETFIAIRQADNGLWSAHLFRQPDGPEIASTGPIHETIADAWSAAFELHRLNIVT